MAVWFSMMGAMALATAALLTPDAQAPAQAPSQTQAQTGEPASEALSAENTQALLADLGVWAEARAERWTRLADLVATPAQLSEILSAPDAEARTRVNAWGVAFDEAITQTSFHLDRAPRLPRLHLLGQEGERLRDQLYVTGDSQQRAIDQIAALGSGMRVDALAVVDHADPAAAGRFETAASRIAAIQAPMRDLADELTQVARAARASDRAAISALSARLQEHDDALRNLTAMEMSQR